jgi:hypothetical protein
MISDSAAAAADTVEDREKSDLSINCFPVHHILKTVQSISRDPDRRLRDKRMTLDAASAIIKRALCEVLLLLLWH